MHLIPRPTTCRSSRIAFWDADRTSVASIWANILLHPVLEDLVRVEEQSVLSSISANGGRSSVKSEQVGTIFLP